MAKIIPSANKEVMPSDGIVDSAELLERTMIVLQREIKNLMTNSAKGKLEASHAKDLVQYVALLSDVEEKRKAQAAGMSDEELEAIARSERKERNRERMRINKMRKHENKPESSETGTAETPVHTKE